MSEEELLLAQDLYLKSGIHIGTKFKTKYMEKFIYKTRPDGLSVLNLQKIDERIKIAAIIGVICFILAWITGGVYYLEYYGPEVKPIIKEGPIPWAHSIAMEVKEHVYLFLPFLSFYALFLIFKYPH